jgi:dolichyl-phosphate-mannose--protein O-mannosyl transferase
LALAAPGASAALAGGGDLPAVLRGLSAVFWGLPLSLLAFARHFLVLWPTIYDLLLPIVATLLLLFGVSRLGRWQPQERIWQRAVLRAQVLALFLVGLAPFLFMWSRAPAYAYYARAVLLLVGVSFAFVVALTRVLMRLSAMLPDETARGDARLFHGLSSYVVMVLVGVGITIYVRLSPISLSDFLALPRQPFGFGRQALLLLLTLVPVAMSMAVAWKLKEVVMAVVTRGRH